MVNSPLAGGERRALCEILCPLLDIGTKNRRAYIVKNLLPMIDLLINLLVLLIEALKMLGC